MPTRILKCQCYWSHIEASGGIILQICRMASAIFRVSSQENCLSVEKDGGAP
jgi:hypothetical protein